MKKYDERINELKKKENDKKQEKSSSKIEAKTEQTASTHYENDYFSVDVPDKWAGIWSFTEITDTSNLGTPSQSAKIYSFKHDPEGNVPFGGAQAIYVFPNGIPSKSESSPMLKKLRSNVYLAPGAASGFFSTDGKPDRATINIK